MTVFRDQNSVLELSRPLPIGRDTSPVIIPGEIFPTAHIDHRLNRENMPRLHEADRLVVRIMRDLRRLMEHCAYTVARVRADYRVAERLDVVCDDVSALLVHRSWLAVLDGFSQTVVGRLDQVDATLAHVANQVSLIHVGVVPVLVHTDIEVDDVTVLQRPSVWDPVADALVYAGAARAREFVVVQR